MPMFSTTGAPLWTTARTRSRGVSALESTWAGSAAPKVSWTRVSNSANSRLPMPRSSNGLSRVAVSRGTWGWTSVVSPRTSSRTRAARSSLDSDSMAYLPMAERRHAGRHAVSVRCGTRRGTLSYLLNQRNVLCLNRNHLFRSIRLRFAHNALATQRNLPNWLVREQLMEAIKANLLSHQIGSFSQRSRYWSRFVTPTGGDDAGSV